MGFIKLTREQAIAAARIDGAVQRLTMGPHRDWPHDKKIASLQAMSGDPIVLGYELGGFLHQAESLHPCYQAAADLLRDCGANEQAAQDMLDFHRRQQAARQAATPTRFEVPGPQEIK